MIRRTDTDFEIEYDAVDNPIEIRDNRLEWEWPAGAKPVSRSIKYDDLYRVKRVDYSYAGSTAWVSPYAAENTSGVTDSRRAEPSPHVAFDNRIAQQTFAFDWLGNTVQTGDDAAGFYDRSLGTVTNGVASGKPYQLLSASNQASGSPRSGRGNAAYDSAGNMTGLLLVRSGACLPTGASCTQRFAYEWDEASRLVRARRWDLATAEGQTASGPLPATAAAVDLRYGYDASDARVLKTAADTTAGAGFDDAARAGRHTVYIFDSIELRGAAWTGAGETADYELSVWTEVPYLLAGSARLGRVHYETDTIPASTLVQARVLLELADHLGSTTTVIDLETGELVEAGTYTAQGTTESDYRPERWESYREDYRFTGKEEDIEVGLTYFGKRFLQAYLGRWMNPDPLALHAPGEGDLDLYAYVHGQVLRAVDPVGLDDECPGNCHAANPEKSSVSGQGDAAQARAFAQGRGPMGAEPGLPSLAEQDAGHAPSRFGIGCPNNCHVAAKAQGHFTGMGPAPSHPPTGTAKLYVSTVSLLPGPGTLVSMAGAIEAGERGDAAGAFFHTVGAAATLIPLGRMALTMPSLGRGGSGLSRARMLAAEGTFLSRSTGPAFDAAKLARIQTNLEAQGVGFITGAEGDAMLRSLGGEAAYLAMEGGRPGVVVLGSNPSRAAVVEELLHLGQHRATGWSPAFGSQVTTFEIQAQHRLLSIGGRLGWTEAELNGIRGALSAWSGK